MRLLEKFKIIAKDFLTKNGCDEEIEICIEISKYTVMTVGKFKNKKGYGIYVSSDVLNNYDYSLEEDCSRVVDALLHECVHIIAEERKLNFCDGDYDFEKLLYDMDITSNYHGVSTAVNIENALIKEKENNEYLSDLLNIPIDDLKEYICQRELEIFIERYYKYIDYLLGDIEEIN